jgi:hypothetical protein
MAKDKDKLPPLCPKCGGLGAIVAKGGARYPARITCPHCRGLGRVYTQ